MTISLNSLNLKGVSLLRRVVCPHCWNRFAPEDVLWVSDHIELMGDAKLGPDHQSRFLPSRFTTAGDAIDPMGRVCKKLACPDCHLPIVRALLESESLFFSIIGVPSCGKSFFLSAATWKLREILTRDFGVGFTDADTTANRPLNEAEQSLFHHPQPNRIAMLGGLIRKTELQGELYDSVSYGQHPVIYPKPYLFSMRTLDRHPASQSGRAISRMMCLYDNAGEHWKPGGDSSLSPVTRHLAISQAILYVFDPTQDVRFRRAAVQSGHTITSDGVAQVDRQETILNEASNRIRTHASMKHDARIDRPLIVVLSKFDSWSRVLGYFPAGEPWMSSSTSKVSGLNVEEIDRISSGLKQLLLRYCPEVVSAAESLSEKVIYIPISALGNEIEIDPKTGKNGIRPASIRPFWVTIPFLYAIQSVITGMIPRLTRKVKKAPTESIV